MKEDMKAKAKSKSYLSGRKMKYKFSARTMASVAMLSAVSFVLMLFDFSVPFIPAFIKMDFSELPALIGSFALGPLAGVLVCFFKNLLHLFVTSTGGVGELSNFMLGAVFVLVAGVVYQNKRTRRGAFVGAIVGSLAMAVMSVFSNYYVVYPVYTAFMPMEGIIAAYSAIYGEIKTLWQALIIFNMPFTFIKGMCVTAISFLIYKKISPILKGSK
ncbi:MAG: ECF transporter S component [Clostridiaceae bacterium]|nr:ECF transporter S component [Clostridiaceae bacterium]